MFLGEKTPKSDTQVSQMVILGLQITANHTLECLPGLKSARQASQTVTFCLLLYEKTQKSDAQVSQIMILDQNPLDRRRKITFSCF